MAGTNEGQSRPPGPPNPPRLDMSPEAIRQRNETATAFGADHSPEGVRQLRRHNQELRAMIEELVWAMHLWSEYENGLHPDAEAAFWAGVAEVNARVESRPGRDGDLAHRFTDPDWVQRQRQRWQERQGD
jgi:hypothetical protein